MVTWNGGALCGKAIYLTYKGVSAGATIVDECMGCPEDGLDLSPGLFGKFVGGEWDDANVGIIYGACASFFRRFGSWS